MFISIRDHGRRRRSHTYGVSKAARSSKLSLLSAITSASHGSNDSSSTVTQESYTRSASGSGKRRRSSQQKRPRESRDRKVSLVNNSPESPDERTMSRESVDVFAFLVDEGNQETPTLHSEGPAEAVPAERPLLEGSDDESIARSQHSDSGISMGDHSVCHPNGDSPLDDRLPPLLEESQEPLEPEVQGQLRAQPTSPRRLRWKWPNVPPATHQHHTPSPSIRTPSPETVRMQVPQLSDDFDQRFCPPRTRASGYDLVAEKLALGELPPIFRHFKKINFRMLLHLQDEIMEMEEELAALDLADATSRRNSDGSMSPASRRINWQWSQSHLQAGRLQVLGRLYIKIEQYYQALSSARKVQKGPSPANPADIERFRAWLRENKPLSALESKFLDDEQDLFFAEATSTPAMRERPPRDAILLCILMTVLLPLVSFKFIPGVLNRLILLTILLAVALSNVEKLDGSKVEQHQQWLLACFGVSSLAAVFF